MVESKWALTWELVHVSSGNVLYVESDHLPVYVELAPVHVLGRRLAVQRRELVVQELPHDRRLAHSENKIVKDVLCNLAR